MLSTLVNRQTPSCFHVDTSELALMDQEHDFSKVHKGKRLFYTTDSVGS